MWLKLHKLYVAATEKSNRTDRQSEKVKIWLELHESIQGTRRLLDWLDAVVLERFESDPEIETDMVAWVERPTSGTRQVQYLNGVPRLLSRVDKETKKMLQAGESITGFPVGDLPYLLSERFAGKW